MTTADRMKKYRQRKREKEEDLIHTLLTTLQKIEYVLSCCKGIANRAEELRKHKLGIIDPKEYTTNILDNMNLDIIFLSNEARITSESIKNAIKFTKGKHKLNEDKKSI